MVAKDDGDGDTHHTLEPHQSEDVSVATTIKQRDLLVNQLKNYKQVKKKLPLHSQMLRFAQDKRN
jgi:hypothetical protein